MATKKKTLKYWKTKIDKPFHEYIRRRDADNNTGYCNCTLFPQDIQLQ